MAGLFKTLRNVIRGKADELSSKLADPERDAKIAIKDSKKQIADFTSKIAALVAETKKIERQRNDTEADVEKFLGIAKKAMHAGNEEDAREALTHKNATQKRLETLQGEVARNKKLVEHLRNELSKARAKVASAEGNLCRLAARNEGAKIRTELAKASSAFNSGESPLAALDDLQNAVDTSESEAEAWEELSADEASPAKSLEEKYGGGGEGVIDVELEELKALVGPSAETKRITSKTQEKNES